MKPKPYQEAALLALNDRNADRVICALPTGTGKGWIAGEIPEWVDCKTGLFLAHTEELVGQLHQHVARVHGALAVSVEMAGAKAWGTPFVVASVPTLAARSGRRLEELGTDRFECLVVDEAHHATASTYRRIWRHHGILAEDDSKPADPRVPLIGLTATPGRGDNVGLHAVFDEIAYQLKLKEAIDQGWLVPIRAWTVETHVDLSKVKIRRGEFVERDLSLACATAERDAIIIDKWRELANGLKTLVFAVDLAHARAMAERWETQTGRPTRWVAGAGPGGMPLEERRDALRWYDKTPGAVLVNVRVATEGVDIPSVECVVMARPTRSATLYAQCLGRGTRLARGAWDIEESRRLGKAEVLLLDASDSGVGVAQRAVNICDIYGAPLPQEKLSGHTMGEVVERQEAHVQQQLAGSLRDLELFGGDPPPSYCRMAWLSFGGAAFELPLPGGRTVRVSSDVLDRWQARMRDRSSGWRDIGEPGTQQVALQAAEAWVAEESSKDLVLVDQAAPWRRHRPSEKQLDLCNRYGLPVPQGATKGQVSDALSRFFAARKGRR